MARLFLDTLVRYRNQGRFLIHEFVLMPDHFHILITPAPEVSLERALQLIKGGFSFRVKYELGSNAEVWQEGFTEHRVRNADDYARHAGYIRENPVEAHLAERAATYPYGSAAGGVELDPVPLRLEPGASTPGLKPRTIEDAQVAGPKSGASTDRTEARAVLRTDQARRFHRSEVEK